jgi:hypothetical protein
MSRTTPGSIKDVRAMSSVFSMDAPTAMAL